MTHVFLLKAALSLFAFLSCDQKPPLALDVTFKKKRLFSYHIPNSSDHTKYLL